MRLLLFLLLVAPLPGITARAGAAPAQLTLAWNANSETNLGGYKLYYGTGPRTYSSSNIVSATVTSNTVVGLTTSTNYFFSVTAFTVNGIESGYSDEISFIIPEKATAPQKPRVNVP